MIEEEKKAGRKKTPRVLIVSHNVASRNTSMGRTLDTYFSGWDRDAIAQLYFHSEVPTVNLCGSWFRYTDMDAVKSVVLRRRPGTVLTEKDVQAERTDAADLGTLTGVYNYGRKRLPYIYLIRDGLWRISGWKHSGMIEWAEKFRPEVIFFASGDYAFPYRIVRFLSKRFQVPCVVCCFDDFYLFDKNEGRFLGRFRQNRFMKVVRETMDNAARILTVNEPMAEAYGKLFGKECGILYTAAEAAPGPAEEEKTGIAYLGGLGLGRERQLAEIADALRAVQGPGVPEFIDVYSGETDPEILGRLQENPGIRFHGAVPAGQVPEIIRKNKAVIHTESFDPVIRERVRFSLSTKIPDSIAGGTCLLAYGPAEVASMDYLIRNGAAFTATATEDLEGTLRRLFTDEEAYRRISASAQALAHKNHDGRQIRAYVRNVLTEEAANR